MHSGPGNHLPPPLSQRLRWRRRLEGAILVGLVGVSLWGAWRVAESGPTKPSSRPSVAPRRAADGQLADVHTRRDGDGEPLPEGARYRLGSRVWTTGESVMRLGWNPPGTRLVALGRGRQLILSVFSGDEGRLLHRSAIQGGYPMGLAVSPGGQVAVGMWDGTIRLLGDADAIWRELEGHPEPFWRSMTRDLHEELGMPTPKWCNYVSAVAFLPDDARLVSAAGNGRLRTWNLGQGTLLAEAAGHAGTISNLAVSPDGSLIASGGDDGRVRLWTPDLERAGPTYRQPGSIMGLRFSADGTRLTVASAHELSITVLSVPQLEVVSRWTGRAEIERACALGEPPGTLAWLDQTGELRQVCLPDDSADPPVGAVPMDGTERSWRADVYPWQAAAIDPAHPRIAYAANNPWPNFVTVRPLPAPAGAPSSGADRRDQPRIRDYALSPDQSRLATVGPGDRVRVVKLASGELESQPELEVLGSQPPWFISQPRWLADHRRLFVHGSDENGWRHWVIAASDSAPDPELDPLVSRATFVDLTWDGRWLTLAVPEPAVGNSTDETTAATAAAATGSGDSSAGPAADAAATATPPSAQPAAARPISYAIHVYDVRESAWQEPWTLTQESSLQACRPSFDRRKLLVIGGGYPLDLLIAEAAERAAQGSSSPAPMPPPLWLATYDLATGERKGELNLGSPVLLSFELTGDNRWLAILVGVWSREESTIESYSLVVVDADSFSIAGRWSLPMPVHGGAPQLRWIGQPPRLWVESKIEASDEDPPVAIARCYEIPAGRLAWELSADLRAGAIVPSSRGDLVAVSRPGSIVELRDGSTGHVVRQFAAPETSHDESSGDSTLTGPLIFSPDDRWLWAADETGRLCRGEVATGTWVAVTRPHRGHIRRVQPISPELGLITQGIDGTLVVWDWPPALQPAIPTATAARPTSAGSVNGPDRAE